MLKRGQRCLPGAFEQRAESRITREVRAHHDRVNEVADEPSPEGTRSSRQRSADRDVRLSGVTLKQDLEDRQQRHVQRGAMDSAQLLEIAGQLRAQLETV